MNEPQSRSPLQDEITDRLLMGQASPQPAGRKILAAMTAVSLLFLVTAAALVGYLVWLAPSYEKADHVELPDMTYRQFVDNVGTQNLDPRGASHIYYYNGQQQRDGKADRWIKMTLPPNSFENLLARQERKFSELKNATDPSNPDGGLKKSTSRRPEMPENWPALREDPPLWWSPESAGHNLHCVRWEIQESRQRAKGWYWAYDRNLETLWIWEWNRQHDLSGGRGQNSPGEEGEGDEKPAESG